MNLIDNLILLNYIRFNVVKLYYIIILYNLISV